MELLNDMRTYNFYSKEWDLQLLQQEEETDQEQLFGGGSVANQKFQSSTFIYKRSHFTMIPFLDRYIVIFGGAGRFIKNIQRRETFQDLQAFDIYKKEWINLNDKKLQTMT